MARNRQEPKDTIGITNNNKIVARGPLLEIFSIMYEKGRSDTEPD